jgi:hypothetical protein
MYSGAMYPLKQNQETSRSLVISDEYSTLE